MTHVAFVEMSMTGAGERCVEYARRAGYAVTVLARDPARYAGVVGDQEIVPCDTVDPAELVRVLARHDATRRIDGVTTTHDLFVPAAAVAADALRLPGLAPAAARRVRDKHAMRLRLAEVCPQLNPPFRLVFAHAEAERAAAELGFPLVAKPCNANDSWNVVRLDDAADVAAYFAARESWGDEFGDVALQPGVLLEGYVDGTEHSVETTQAPGGPIELMAVTCKELLGADGRHFAEAGIALPVTGRVADAAFGAARTALDALGVDCGVVHTEVRIRGDQVTVIEVNARLAGDMTGSDMIELATGASAVEQVVESALGRRVEWRPTTARAAGKYAVVMPRTGRFAGITNVEELLALPGVVRVRPAQPVGAQCANPPRSNLDFVARVIAVDSTPSAAMDRAKSAAERADVQVAP